MLKTFSNKGETNAIPLNAENVNFNFTELDNRSISESGSNDAGSWIKFNNGFMIVTQHKICDPVDITVADGQIFRGNIGTLPDFPIEFSEPPVVSLILTNAFKVILAGQEGNTTTKRAFDNFGVSEIIGVESATNRINIENINIHLIAIGKWK